MFLILYHDANNFFYIILKYLKKFFIQKYDGLLRRLGIF